MIILEVFIGLLVLMLLVVAHEFGHAYAATKSGVVVEEFGVGLPPSAKKKKLKNGLTLSLNWLPLGGFVKLQGEYDSADKKGDYGAATFWQKTKILFAGVVANWLVAIILLTILAFFGLPKIVSDQFSIASDTTTIYTPIEITSIQENGAASKAGLQAGDEIMSFAGQDVSSVTGLIDLSENYQNQSVEVAYSRDGVRNLVNLELGNKDEDGYIIGAGLGQGEFIKATWSAPIVGVVTTAQYTWLTLAGVGNLIANLMTVNMQSVGDSVSGPVGILGSIFPSAIEGGLTQLVFLTAIVSLSLAVMNILPLPALDGGRWFITTIYKLAKKTLTKEREEKIQAAGFYFLMGLVVLVTINDIVRLF